MPWRVSKDQPECQGLPRSERRTQNCQQNQCRSSPRPPSGTRPGVRSAYLLDFEEVVVEVALKLLIGIVDAKLLKRIGFKCFETVDIKDANR